MNIDRQHQMSSFTPHEIAWLHENDRILSFDDTRFASPDYPYVVLTEPKGAYVSVDAWFINASGEKDPQVGGFQPVLMSEVSSVDFAVKELRGPLMSYLRRAQANPQVYSANEMLKAVRTSNLVRIDEAAGIPAAYGIVSGSELQPIDYRGRKFGSPLKTWPAAAVTAIKVGDVPEEITFYASKRYSTFVFGVHRDARHNLALGCGRDGFEARADAIIRMGLRYPALLGKSIPPELELQNNLLQGIIAGDVQVVSMKTWEYPSQESFGHDYMSHDTVTIAQSLSSDERVCAWMVQSSKNGMSLDAKSQYLEQKFKRLNPSLKIEYDLVDWAEVLDSFPESIAEREVGQKVSTEVLLPKSDPKVPKGKGVTGAVLDRFTDTDETSDLDQYLDGHARKTRRIDDDVLQILSRCHVEGTLIRLPDERLAPKLYKKVDEVLRALGGKWVGRKVMAHEFAEDPSAVLYVALRTGSFVKLQDFGFFPTQPPLVARVMPMADIQPGMLTMEPSAGDGAFALPMAEMTGAKSLVTVCELLPVNVQKLRNLGFDDVRQGDFLSMMPNPIYNRIVMNPPFGGGADVEHVMHATKFLKPDGKLTAITSPSWESNGGRKFADFRDFMEQVDGQVQDVEQGAFKASGTNIGTRIVTMSAENFPWHQRELERQR